MVCSIGAMLSPPVICATITSQRTRVVVPTVQYLGETMTGNADCTRIQDHGLPPADSAVGAAPGRAEPDGDLKVIHAATAKATRSKISSLGLT